MPQCGSCNSPEAPGWRSLQIRVHLSCWCLLLHVHLVSCSEAHHLLIGGLTHVLSAAGFWEFDNCFPGLYMVAVVQDATVQAVLWHLHLSALQDLESAQTCSCHMIVLLQDLGGRVVGLLVCTC